MSQRLRALAAYRSIWRASRAFPNDERIAFVRLKLRTGYEENRGLVDPQQIDFALQLAELQLDNVEHQAGHLSHLAQEEAAGRGKFNPVVLPG